ncbi:MAG TPA: BTAD domain-containing putative transcriptional regulator [Mycobacteriales bacterium]|nr:BTAD domain-containing putative transcriptional regulator [Mycobacteriales bacterium]
MPLRVYLTGRVAIETPDGVLDESALPGRQGRLLLTYLVMSRASPVTRDQVADALWAGTPPAAWSNGLNALVSKLRSVLRRLEGEGVQLGHSFGCYQLRLPVDAWVDVDAARDAIHHAEALLAQRQNESAAWGWTYVGYHVTHRPFLPGERGPWVEARRAELALLRLRALDCTIAVNTAIGDIPEALRAGDDALAIDPLRESTYQQLMRCHFAAGSRAEALRVYERCRANLGETLGVDPSPETESVYLEILRS